MNTPGGLDSADALLRIPLNATPAWIEAATEAGGQCTCAGQCGRSHTSKPQRRCDHTLTGQHRLYLARSGRMLCGDCYDGVRRAHQRAERERPAEAEQPGLFDL